MRSPDTGSGSTLFSSRNNYLRKQLAEVPPFRALIRSIECRLFEDCGPLSQPVLDLGCGDGHFASVAFSGPPLVGLDAEWTLVSEARSRCVYSLNVCACASGLPFPSNFFATIISNCVLEHIPDLDAALAESNRVLCPEGRFLFGVPSQCFGEFLFGATLARRIGLKGLGEAYGRWFNRHSRHFHVNDPERWRKRLRGHGFEVRRWLYYMTPRAHLVFDLLHYLSLPHLVSRKLTSRWVLPGNPLSRSIEAWLRPHVESSPCPSGAYLFFDAFKAQERPKSD